MQQHNCSPSMQDGVPIPPDYLNTMMKEVYSSDAQLDAFNAVKNSIGEYLASEATLPVSTGALCVRSIDHDLDVLLKIM